MFEQKNIVSMAFRCPGRGIAGTQEEIHQGLQEQAGKAAGQGEAQGFRRAPGGQDQPILHRFIPQVQMLRLHGRRPFTS
jgi:hypothetical protein